MEETWKPAPGYAGYEISDAGRVRSLKHGRARVLRGGFNQEGYLRFYPSIENIKFCADVHRVVMMAFHPRSDASDLKVRHLDGNKANNALSNLRWGTAQENSDDMVRHDRSTKGSRSANTRLTEQDVERARSELASGATLKQICQRYLIAKSTASYIKNRRTWRHC